MRPMRHHDIFWHSARLAPAALAALAALVLLGCARPGSPQAGAAAPPLPGVSYVDHLAAGGIVPPGLVLRNPHAGDAGVAKGGALLFKSMNCDGCHGGDASGWVGPNLGDGRWRYGGADAEVFSSIYYGRPKGMPAFGGALGADGVWTLVTYLRTLPLPPDLPTESWEDK
jgi:cytochrome c oxidase cbb3-type subunit 3